MRALGPITLAVAFLLELAVLVALAYWGFTRPVGPAVRVVVGIGAPLLMAVLWGLFAAPRASMPLGGVAGAAFRIAWFAVGALALATAGRTAPAIVLAAVYLVSSGAPAVTTRHPAAHRYGPAVKPVHGPAVPSGGANRPVPTG